MNIFQCQRKYNLLYINKIYFVKFSSMYIEDFTNFHCENFLFDIISDNITKKHVTVKKPVNSLPCYLKYLTHKIPYKREEI